MDTKVSINLATIESRKDILINVIASLKNQTVKPDVIRIYANDYLPQIEDDLVECYVGEDLTDKGKFYFVDYGDDVYFSADDDIFYPPDYIETTLKALEKYPNHLVTYHGRKLLGKNRNYYFGHKQFHCLYDIYEDTIIDIPGTGVSAFNTSTFTPDILQYPEQKMADVLMGLECAKANVPIVCLKHSAGWLYTAETKGIYNEQKDRCYRQSVICDEIWHLRGCN